MGRNNDFTKENLTVISHNPYFDGFRLSSYEISAKFASAPTRHHVADDLHGILDEAGDLDQRIAHPSQDDDGILDLYDFMVNDPLYAKMLFNLIFTFDIRTGLEDYRLPLEKRIKFAKLFLKHIKEAELLMKDPEDAKTFSSCFRILSNFVDLVNDNEGEKLKFKVVDRKSTQYPPQKKPPGIFDPGTLHDHSVIFEGRKYKLKEAQVTVDKNDSLDLHNEIYEFLLLLGADVKESLLLDENLSTISSKLHYIYQTFSNRANQDFASDIINGKANIIGSLYKGKNTNIMLELLNYLKIATSHEELINLNSKIEDFYRVGFAENELEMCCVLVRFTSPDFDTLQQLYSKISQQPEDKKTLLLKSYYKILEEQPYSVPLHAHMRQVLSNNPAVFPQPNKIAYMKLYKQLVDMIENSQMAQEDSEFKKNMVNFKSALDMAFSQSKLLSIDDLLNFKPADGKLSIKAAVKKVGVFPYGNRIHIDETKMSPKEVHTAEIQIIVNNLRRKQDPNAVIEEYAKETNKQLKSIHIYNNKMSKSKDKAAPLEGKVSKHGLFKKRSNKTGEQHPTQGPTVGPPPNKS